MSHSTRNIHIPKEELERLYYEEGLSTSEIGKRYGVSNVTIINRMKSYGMTRRDGTIRLSREVLIQLYYEEQLTQREIAGRLGVSLPTVQHRMQEFGIETRGKPVELPAETVQAMYEGGRTIEDIAAHFGVSTTTVAQRLEKLGVKRRTSQDYNRFVLAEDELAHLYFEKGLSLAAIGEMFGVTSATVRRRMIDCGLEPRQRGEDGFITKQRSDYIAIPKHELETLYYEKGLSLSQIAEYYGATDGTIANRMKEYGMVRRKRGAIRTLVIPENELHRLYVEEQWTAPAIAEKYGCATSQVYLRLRECGITIRAGGWDKIKVQVHPERLDWSPEFAYIVGLITSDGNLRSGGNEVKFTSTDRELIDIYCSLLGLRPDYVPADQWTDPDAPEVHVLVGEGKESRKTVYRVAFSDPVFRSRLEEIGLTPSKSNTLGPSPVPDEYFRDFLRGEFDGDGSWYLATSRNRQYLRSNIVSGSSTFREWLLATIWRLSPIRTGYIFNNALWFGTRASEQLGAFMYYRSDVPTLSRKRQIWQKWMGTK